MKSQKIEVVPFRTAFYYSEDRQAQVVKFSYASKLKEDRFKQLSGYFVCRDFLGDVLFSEEKNIPIKIYGFCWNPADGKIDRDKTRLLLKFSNEKQEEFLIKNLNILNEIEKENDLELTEISQSTEAREFLLEGDRRWQSSIILISAYSFLLKCLTYEIKDSLRDVQKFAGNEAVMLSGNNYDRLTKILKNLKRFGFDEKSSKFTVSGTNESGLGNTIHHYSGWYSHVMNSLGHADYHTGSGNSYYEIVKEVCG